MAPTGWEPATGLSDLPDVILSNIFALVTDTRARNSLSLVCRKYLALERSTRSSLILRGNVRDLLGIPVSFRRVTNLDLSLLSPWGTDLLSAAAVDPYLLAHRLCLAFPEVTSLTVYARSFLVLQILLPLWPHLSHVKLVRWHQRPPQSPLGADFDTLFRSCSSLRSLDLSSFYYYTEDLPPVLQACPQISAGLTRLDLLTVSFSEGFKSHEISVITSSCTNLKEFLVACTFDPRYIGFVGDQALLDIATNCPSLTLLHLVDTNSLSNARVDPEEDGFASEDAGITREALVEVFSRLTLLEELVLDVCRNVRESGSALEVLNSKCKNLRTLKLGHFQGVVMAIESQLDGLAKCQGLTSLSIKNSADLTDMGLIEIGKGCSNLVKFEVQGCKNITWMAMRTLTTLLRRTLVDVSISCCKNLGAAASLRSVDPVRDQIQRLHIDCVWDGLELDDCEKQEEVARNFDLNQAVEPSGGKLLNFYGSELEEDSGRHKKCRYSLDLDANNSSHSQSNGNGFFSTKSWEKLRYLSLWIGVGELLNPLQRAGLEDCPSLEEIRIRVEGDCRGRQKPAVRAFGLSTLAQYRALSKMQLDCGDAIGYALTAPSGQMDLSLWERFFLNGIGDLSLSELDYWPPQDRDVNQRSLSLPAAGLLAECRLRKLFIHGTAHEHFMNFLLRIPNLRDVQLREDYYPAPENDMSTEMRVDSCSRFEDALNRRHILD
ncbi:hypothetical protein CRG98_036898 [Punica granatum]|uniref:COI1 F-box domain-containing protein n=1 Tax=Punica granatum TaxID=22663 RepID=A0A2I0IGG0_PUNGR|nr:hypothetical protein CRG98_036898 [Punica granatum]